MLPVDRSHERNQLVAHLVARFCLSPPLVAAFISVTREVFVPPHYSARAYVDAPLPIGAGQTISAPSVVAQMLSMLPLRPKRVLEIGAGSGYVAAVLGRIAGQVVAIERIAELARDATNVLVRVGATNVILRHGDGSAGWRELAPYDAIVVSALAPSIHEQLIADLAPGGVLVCPVGTRSRREGRQHLVCVKKDLDGQAWRHVVGATRFVPLIGKGGFNGPEIAQTGPRVRVRSPVRCSNILHSRRGSSQRG